MGGGGKDDRGGFANASKVVYPYWVDEDGRILKPHIEQKGGTNRLVVSDTDVRDLLGEVRDELKLLNTYMAEIVGEDLKDE